MRYLMAKIATLFFSIIVFVIPFATFAKCVENGTTVVYVNGINTSKQVLEFRRKPGDNILLELHRIDQTHGRDNFFILSHNK